MTKWAIICEGTKPVRWGEFVGEVPTEYSFFLRDFSTGKPVLVKISNEGSSGQVLKYPSRESFDQALKTFSLPPLVLEQAPMEFRPIVTVTGHRPDKLGGYKVPNPVYDKVVFGLSVAFDLYKPSLVITGMSLGTDQWAAELCLNMGIPFTAAIPFENQDSKWPPHARAKYQWLLGQAASKYIVSPGSYEGWKMQKRNQWMVNNCHGVIAVFNGTPGGTANCLGYATQVGKPIYYVPIDLAGMPIGEIPSAPVAVTPKQEQAPVAAETKRVIEL